MKFRAFYNDRSLHNIMKITAESTIVMASINITTIKTELALGIYNVINGSLHS
jgi:hypothetical protein